MKRRGYSLIEILVVVALIGIMALISVGAWNNYQKRANIGSTARMLTNAVSVARMLAVTRGVTHWVVIDPAQHLIRIYSDNASPGVWDASDTRISTVNYSSVVEISLPAQPSPLSSPLDGSTMTSAWGLPLPDPTSYWGSSLRGFAVTPLGRFRSAEAAPQIISSGAIVLTDQTRTSAVGVRGELGSIRSYVWVNNAWKTL